MSSRDWKKSKDGRKLPPLFGGPRDLSYVHVGKEDLEVTPEDLYNNKYSFRTDDEFKFLIAYYLDAIRRKKGLKADQVASNLGKASSAFAVLKFDGVSTFERFFRWCYGLGIDPIQAFERCVELAAHFRNK